MISSSLFSHILPFISKLTSNILPWKASNFSNSIFNYKLHPLKLIIFWTSFCGFQRIYSSNSSLRYDSYQTLDSTNLQPKELWSQCSELCANLHTHTGFKWPSHERTVDIVCKYFCNTYIVINLAMLTTMMQQVFIIWIFSWATSIISFVKIFSHVAKLLQNICSDSSCIDVIYWNLRTFGNANSSEEWIQINDN